MRVAIAFNPIYFPQNKGLGNALRVAVESAKNELIARMDSDDISAPTRFERQVECFSSNPKLDIVGGDITEFIGESSNITGKRVVPTTDRAIKQDMKKRCAMNHVTVMYKRDAVQKSGGYLDWPWNEDYYLWIRMALAGCNFTNVPEPLVNVRVGDAMSARRGGWKYFSSEARIQKYMLDNRMIGLPRYLYNVAIRFGGEVVVSNNIRNKLFKFFREKVNVDDVPEKKEKTVVQEKIGMNYPPFSVAMSVYGKDNPEWFDTALASVVNQTVKPDEIVLVVDGPVPDGIQRVIDKYAEICAGGYTL